MGTKRRVTYDGREYTVRRDTIEIPNLNAMDRFGALIWLNQNTYATGKGTRTKSNPLNGYGGTVISA
jgi:hypothetical protein